MLLNSGSEITEALVVIVLGNKEINLLGRRIGDHGGPTSGDRIGIMGEVPLSFPGSVSKVEHSAALGPCGLAAEVADQLALGICANALDLAADISNIAVAAGIAGSGSPRAYRHPVIQGNVKGVTIRLVTIIVEEAAIATAVRHRDALVFLLDVDKFDRARGGLDNTKAFQCDIGLGNYGNGWVPTAYCKGQKPDTGSGTFGLETPLNNQNAVVDITYTVSKTATQDKIVGVFKVGSQTVAQVTYTAKAGELFRNGGTTASPKPLVRFVRFMSLVPLSATTDDADNTTMEATMTNFKLGSKSWDKSLIEYAWSVQGANIESLKIGNLTPSTVGTNADYIKINHRYQLH